MSLLTIDQEIYLTALLSTIFGIAITWAVYYGSDRAELPGEARIPDPAVPGEEMVDTTGRTL